MPAYEGKFPGGSEVQIADSSSLEQFRASWRLHNSLQPEQLAYAGKRAVVAEVGYYHGGDPLYVLVSVA